MSPASAKQGGGVRIVRTTSSPAVTVAVYGGIVSDGREKAAAKLVEAGFGR